MNLPRSLRILIAMAIVVLGLASMLLLLMLSESLLSVRAHLAAESPWLQFAWWGALGLVGLLFGWLVWRLLRPSGPASRQTPAVAAKPPTEDEVLEAVDIAEAAGADTAAIRRELEVLQRRREAGSVHVALFGEISTGKSALVNALLPDAGARSDVRGGTTRELANYAWETPSGDRLTITDMPGLAEAGGKLDQASIEEAKRAHVVIYVADSDLNREQRRTLDELLALHKPVILVLNKSDRYSAADAGRLGEKLAALVEPHPNAVFVTVAAAGRRPVVRQLPDGSEVTEQRPTAARVEPLALALQRLIDNDPQALEQLRDSATFILVKQKLDQAVLAARCSRAEKIVDGYSVKAVVGALAAVTPGTDLVIQGWLATRLIKDLAALFDTRVGKVDTELLLELVQRHVGRAHTLLLAVAGNALKAFPGIGTLAGGALHAVAYGIIFRTLGRALTTTLATRGELHPRQTARLFEDTLGGSLEKSAEQAARLVAEQARENRTSP